MKKSCAWAKKVDKVVFRIMKGVSYAAAIALIAVAVLCTADVIGAKVFDTSVPNGTEWVTYLNIPVVFLAISFVQVERGHTTVDLLSSKFSPALQKLITVIGNVMGILVCGYLTYTTGNQMLDKLDTMAKASSSANSFVVWPFALMIAVGFGLLAVAYAWCLIREFTVKPEERMGALPPTGEEGEPCQK